METYQTINHKQFGDLLINKVMKLYVECGPDEITDGNADANNNPLLKDIFSVGSHIHNLEQNN